MRSRYSNTTPPPPPLWIPEHRNSPCLLKIMVKEKKFQTNFNHSIFYVNILSLKRDPIL